MPRGLRIAPTERADSGGCLGSWGQLPLTGASSTGSVTPRDPRIEPCGPVSGEEPGWDRCAPGLRVRVGLQGAIPPGTKAVGMHD
jgi:hypothetical protein